MRRLESNNGETDQAYGLEPILADSDETVSFDEIVTHIRDVVDLQPSILEALSKSNVEMLKSLLVLWEEIPTERLRAVLENLVILTRNDRTFDFRAIFISTLRNKDIPVRIFSIRGLVEEEQPEILHLFLDCLRDEVSDLVKVELAEALGNWVVAAELGVLSTENGEILVTALRETIEDIETDDAVRGRALESLGALSGELISELITEQYELGGNELRLGALRAMGRSASPTWLDLLVFHFDDEDVSVREAAAEASGGLVTDGAIEPLTMLLEEDGELSVRVAAINALAEIGSADAERVLERIFQDGRDPSISKPLEHALNSLQMNVVSIFGMDESADEKF